MLETIQGVYGDVWFLMNGETILYITTDGTLKVRGDVIAYATLPSPPQNRVLHENRQRQSLLTDFYHKI